MFGAPSLLPSVDTDIEVEEDSNKKQSTETASATSLISDQALAQCEYTTKLGVIKEAVDDTAGAAQQPLIEKNKQQMLMQKSLTFSGISLMSNLQAISLNLWHLPCHRIMRNILLEFLHYHLQKIRNPLKHLLSELNTRKQQFSTRFLPVEIKRYQHPPCSYSLVVKNPASNHMKQDNHLSA